MLVDSWSKESLQGLCFDTPVFRSACVHWLRSSPTVLLPTRGKDSRGHGGIMALTTPLQAEHQLDQLAGQFEHWRQTTSQAGAHIPEPLWAQAVALAAVLTLPGHGSLTVEFQRPDGARLHLHAPDMALPLLALVQ